MVTPKILLLVYQFIFNILALTAEPVPHQNSKTEPNPRKNDAALMHSVGNLGSMGSGFLLDSVGSGFLTDSYPEIFS
jgi:hypothetical protein